MIREWFKEAQINVPNFVDETIYNLGQSYAFLWQNIKFDVLMNGNTLSNNKDFDEYLKRFGYKFKNENLNFQMDILFYPIKRFQLLADTGASPPLKFSPKYQSGALSFEINSNGKKLFTNCGFYEGQIKKLVKLSKSTATQMF